MIVLTGGAGFLGLHTAEALAAAGEAVVVAGRRRHPAAEELARTTPGITVEVCDLTQAHEVHDLFSRYDVDAVVHTATAHMAAATRSANLASHTMLLNCLEAATTCGARRFVLAGSWVVYRGVDGPFREDRDLPVEITPDAPPPLGHVPRFEVATKRVAELLTLDYGTPIHGWDRAPAVGGRPRRQLEVVVTRCPGQFGPRYTSMHSPLSNVVHAAARGREVPSDRSPRTVTDSVYVKDSASALVALVRAPTLQHRVYNVSGGFGYTAAELLAAVGRGSGHVAVEERRAPLLDASRLRDELGWRPAHSLDSAVADYLEWLRDHEF